MIKPGIIVTGATGKTGSVVVTELLKALGAEIAVADMSDVERIADALKDVQGAYYCLPLDPYMIQGAVAFRVWIRHAFRVEIDVWLASPPSG